MDRDPPDGRPIWHLEIKVTDGQQQRQSKTKGNNLHLRSLSMKIEKNNNNRNELKGVQIDATTQQGRRQQQSHHQNETAANEIHEKAPNELLISKPGDGNDDFHLVNPIRISEFQARLRIKRSVPDPTHNPFLQALRFPSVNQFRSRKTIRWRTSNHYHPVRIRRRRNFNRTFSSASNKVHISPDVNEEIGLTQPILDGGNCVRLESLTANLDSVHEAQLDYMISALSKVRPRNTPHTTVVNISVLAKDVNDNAPKFLNTTIYGEVQENGPIGKYKKLFF